MIEMRMRTVRTNEWAEKVAGTFVTPAMLGVRLTSIGEPVRILRPDGKPLCIYLPQAAREITDQTFEEFSKIRIQTTNRGYASGSERHFLEGAGRGRTEPVTSAILGSFDPAGGQTYCRLTAFTAREVDRWESLQPYFQRIAELLEEHVPDRYAAQVRYAQATHPDWIIRDTPFTTITVNNTYPTAVHTDKGDLDSGFSTLGVMRRGNFEGGHLSFPQYGISVDMQHGDVLLMDAHDWHGNTPMHCSDCGEKLRRYEHSCEQGEMRAAALGEEYVSPERVSIVCYFRTKMVGCDSMTEEIRKRGQVREKWSSKAIGLANVEAEEERLERERV